MQENKLLINAIDDFLQFIPLPWWEHSTYGLSWMELIDGKPIAFEAQVLNEHRISELRSEAIHLRVWNPETIRELEDVLSGPRIRMGLSADWFADRQQVQSPGVLSNHETRKRYRALSEPLSGNVLTRELLLSYPFDFVQSVLMCMPLHRWERLLMDLTWDGKIDGKEFHAEATVLEKTEERILVSASVELSDLSPEMSELYEKFFSAGSLFELILREN